MKKEVCKKTRANLLSEVQSHFDFLARASRHELHGEASVVCHALLAQMTRFIEVLERDQRRELS